MYSDYEFGFSLRFSTKNYIDYFYCENESKYRMWMSYLNKFFDNIKEKELRKKENKRNFRRL